MSILGTILCLSLLIILHELGHYLVARACNMRVLRFSVGFGPSLLKYKVGETVWQFAAIPLGGFVQIDGMGPEEEEEGDETADKLDPHTFRGRPVWQRIVVIFAGPAANWLLAAAFVATSALTVGFNRYDPQSTALGEIGSESRAEQASLQSGDRVLAVDGEQVETWAQLVAAIEAHPETTIVLKIERSGELLELEATPAKDGAVGRLGVGPLPETVRLGVLGALAAGFRGAWRMTEQYTGLLWGMIIGKQEGKLSGLPGIVKMVAGQAERGLRYLFEILAWLSIGLFILNLLPIPALDGGRLVFLGLETIRGKPVNARLEGMVHAVGFFFIVGLMVFVSVRDLL